MQGKLVISWLFFPCFGGFWSYGACASEGKETRLLDRREGGRARDENGVLRAVAYAGSSIIYICNYAFYLYM